LKPIVVALIPAMAAREVVVAVLGTVYAIGGGEGASGSLGAALAHQWPLPTALSLLAWFVFAPQCASTLSVVRRETNSWRWPVVMFAYMSVLAYAAAFATYHLAQLFGL
jgi:ferrous iron transport protein B